LPTLQHASHALVWENGSLVPWSRFVACMAKLLKQASACPQGRLHAWFSQTRGQQRQPG
jgi:hypothetical protein